MADYSTNAVQAGDVLMFMVDDRGEIEEKDGFLTMTESFETMIHLCLFGGNEDDDGSESTEKDQWWGNEGELALNQYRSHFQYEVSRGQPLTSASVTTLAEAAAEDLENTFIVGGYAESVEIDTVEVVNPKRVKVTGRILLDSENVIPFEVEGEV